MKTKASSRAVAALQACQDFLAKPGEDPEGYAYWNGASLHIFLCDQNIGISDLLFCRDCSIQRCDPDALKLSQELLQLSRPEREYLGAMLS